MRRMITLHAFCSAKGGVGKSTLALASAQLLCERARTPVVIDSDLTGTSLAEGLLLCAPVVTSGAGDVLDLDAPPTGRFHSVEETWRLRDLRKLATTRDLPRYLPFFNDALAYRSALPEHDCRVDALLWRHQEEDGVWYLPSSSLSADVERALGWLYQDEGWKWSRRLAWLLDQMARLLPSLSDVIIDLPPGLFGYAHETLTLLAYLSQGEPIGHGFPHWRDNEFDWRVNPFLVMSPDRGDVYTALESYVKLAGQLAPLRPLVNRVMTTESSESIQQMVRERFGPSQLEESLLFVENRMEDLGRWFREGVLRRVPDAFWRNLGHVLRLDTVTGGG